MMDAKRPSIKESEVFYESCPGRNQYSLEIHGQGGCKPIDWLKGS